MNNTDFDEDADTLLDPETIKRSKEVAKNEKNNDTSSYLTHEQVWNS